MLLFSISQNTNQTSCEQPGLENFGSSRLYVEHHSPFTSHTQKRSQLYHCNPRERSKQSQSLLALVSWMRRPSPKSRPNPITKSTGYRQESSGITSTISTAGESSHSGYIFATSGSLRSLFFVGFKSTFKTCSKSVKQKHGWWPATTSNAGKRSTGPQSRCF